MATTILWFRRNLRLCDNRAVLAAAEGDGPVIPLYVVDELDVGGASQWWLHRSLEKLAASLTELGSALVVREGDPASVIRSLIAETDARRLCYSRRYEPAARAQERELATLADDGIEITACEDTLLNGPDATMTLQGAPYKVFTPFWKAASAHAEPPLPEPAPSSIEGIPNHNPGSIRLPREPQWALGFHELWQPGEDGAHRQLEHATAIAADYSDLRDRPDKDATSRLSPHLHFGEISPRQVWHAIRATGRGEALIRQLYWREFSTYLLYHFPTLPDEPLRPEFERFPWIEDAQALEAWQRGQTGYPIVDAGMRQLWQTGWMHNRVRMITASFLIKDLMIHWRHGADWFLDTLVDADLGNNSASWQWVAGCGTDAAPYFRIFNPTTQGKKFDPDGSYVRRYVPELRELPTPFIHEPWTADEFTLETSGVEIGKDYPAPIVDHKEARERALAAYKLTRDLLKSGPGQSP